MSALPAYPGSSAVPASSGAPPVLCETACGSVTLQQRVISALAGQLDEGFRLAPRGGVEMGGLLIGTTSPKGDVVVEEVVPITIEYKFGPSFRLSETDAKSLKKSIVAADDTGAGSVVGVYRSQCRGVPDLRPSDEEFLQLVEMVDALAELRAFLLLRRQSKIHFSTKTHLYDGAAWSNAPEVTIRHGVGPATIEPPDQSIPSDVAPAAIERQMAIVPPPAARPLPEPPETPPAVPDSTPITAHPQSALPAPAADPRPADAPAPFADPTPIAAPPQSAVPAPASAPAPAVDPPPAERIAAPRRYSTRMYLIGVAVAIGIGLGAGYGLFSPAAGEQPPSVVHAASNGASLGFAAVRQNSDWKLTWRRALVFALEPSGAILTIVDGGTEKQIRLGLDELAIGSIVYSPHSGDISFSLELTDAAHPSAKERIRVLDPSFRPPAEPAPAAAGTTRSLSGSPVRVLAPSPHAPAQHNARAGSR